MSTLDHITMIDLSEGMLSRAQAKAANLRLGEQVDFVSGDVQNLPFDRSTFDTVTDTFSFCVFSDPQAAMNEMARVLKPGVWPPPLRVQWRVCETSIDLCSGCRRPDASVGALPKPQLCSGLVPRCHRTTCQEYGKRLLVESTDGNDGQGVGSRSSGCAV